MLISNIFLNDRHVGMSWDSQLLLKLTANGISSSTPKSIEMLETKRKTDKSGKQTSFATLTNTIYPSCWLARIYKSFSPVQLATRALLMRCFFFLEDPAAKVNHTMGWILFNRSWRISTTPNTPTFFFIRFKLIQQSNMVILSCLAKKNQNLNVRKKSSVYYWKGRFVGVSALKMQLSVINWTFFPQIQILIFLCEATQNDHIRLLYKFENNQ